MITSIAIIFAAFLNAVMDCVENEHIWSTVFSKWKHKAIFDKFIYKRESWRYAKMIGGYRFDLWHLSKSAMIGCVCAAIVFYQPVFKWWIDFSVAGVLWVLVFNFSYNHLLKLKENAN
jgi:hypothetical protein